MSLTKEILGFRKAKLLLPAAFIAVLILPLYSFFAIGSLENKYACELVSIGEDIVAARSSGNATFILETEAVKKGKMIDIFRDIANETASFQDMQNATLIAIALLGPMENALPYPCEFYPEKPLCQYYSSPLTYQCGLQAPGLSAVPQVQAVIGYYVIKPYMPFLIPYVALLLLAAFALGYLISGVLLAVKRRAKG